MNQQKINIVLTGDNNYVTQIGVTMYSILRTLSREFCPQFFLIVIGWSESDIDKIQKLKKIRDCEISFINPDNSSSYFKNQKKDFFVYYSRLLIPKILPESVESCFFIDGDMIIDDDLGKLNSILSQNQLCAAVVDSIHQVSGIYREKVEKQFSYLKDYDEFHKFNNDKLSAPYFNAGFMVLNLNLMRKLDVFSDFLSFLNKHNNPPFRDQDVLNAVLGQKYSEKMLYLSIKWNLQCAVKHSIESCLMVGADSINNIKEAILKPSVYHYSGDSKPWQSKIGVSRKDVYESYETAYSELVQNEYKKTERIFNTNIKLLSFIPFLRIEKDNYNHATTVFLFNYFPIYSKKLSRTSLYLLSPIVLLSIRKKDNKTFVLLLNFLKILTIS